MLQLPHYGSGCCRYIMVGCRWMCLRAVIIVPRNITSENLRLRDKGTMEYKLCFRFKTSTCKGKDIHLQIITITNLTWGIPNFCAFKISFCLRMNNVWEWIKCLCVMNTHLMLEKNSKGKITSCMRCLKLYYYYFSS